MLLLNSLFSLATNKTSKLIILVPLWGTYSPVISGCPLWRTCYVEMFTCHDIIISPAWELLPCPHPTDNIWSNLKLDQTLKCSGLKYTPLITTKFCTFTLSWHVQNFVVIGWASLKLHHSKFWSNLEFNQNTVSGMGSHVYTPASVTWDTRPEIALTLYTLIISLESSFCCQIFYWWVALKFHFESYKISQNKLVCLGW